MGPVQFSAREERRVESFDPPACWSSLDSENRVRGSETHRERERRVTSSPSSDHCSGLTVQSPKHQHWLTLKGWLFPLSPVYGCNHVAGKSQGHSRFSLHFMLLCLCVLLSKHWVIIYFQASRQRSVRELMLFGLVVFTESSVFLAVDNTGGIRWLSERAEGELCDYPV